MSLPTIELAVEAVTALSTQIAAIERRASDRTAIIDRNLAALDQAVAQFLTRSFRQRVRWLVVGR